MLVRFMTEVTFHPPNDLVLFLAYLFKNNLRYNTILTYVTAISYYHKLQNLPDPQDSFIVAKTLQGIKNSCSSLPPLMPISKPVLHKLLDHVPRVTTNPYSSTLYTALFLFMYYACLRIGEVSVSHHDDNILSLDNLHLVHQGSRTIAFILHFHTHKTQPRQHTKTSHQFSPKPSILPRETSSPVS